MSAPQDAHDDCIAPSGPAKRRWRLTDTGIASCGFRRFSPTLGTRQEPIATAPIRCPARQASNIRRSRPRSVQDFLFSFVGILPWRCGTCHTRFRARLLPLHTLFYAHCANCGSTELQRISADRVPGAAAALGRILGLPALRCALCRRRFFSVRPLRQEARPAETAPSE